MTTMSIDTDAALYRLLTWLSPGYPLGAYSYSHGLEQAVEAGLVRDAEGLARWITTILEAGAGLSDAALFAAAWRAVAAEDAALFDETVELAAAWRGTAETALESEAQGAAFLAITRSAWPHATLDALARRHRIVVLPVAVAAAAAAHGIALSPALLAYLHSFAANLVSAGVRLIPLGQSDGQRIIAALEDRVAARCRAACAMPLDAVGTAAPRVDWCSMRHETQYTRLFRS
jgi:urease accessory protein